MDTTDLTPEEAYRYATGRCARAELCRADLRPKLLARGLPPPAADALLDRLEEEGYLDARRYAAAFVHDKVGQNRWGRVKVKHALCQKGIPPAVADEALAAVDGTAYAALLDGVLAAKMRTVRASGAYDLRVKLLRFAASRGFEAGLAAEAVDRLVGDGWPPA